MMATKYEPTKYHRRSIRLNLPPPESVNDYLEDVYALVQQKRP